MEAKIQIAKEITSRLSERQKTRETAINMRLGVIKEKLQLLHKKHNSERGQLSGHQEQRWGIETKERQNHFNLLGFNSPQLAANEK